MMFVQEFDGACDLAASAFALHARGRKQYVHGARAPADDVQDVAYGRARARGDHSDATWKERKPAFSLFVKKSFRRETVSHLLERHAQRASAH